VDGKGKYQNVICYRCGKPGHLSTICKASEEEAAAFAKRNNKKFVPTDRKTFAAEVEIESEDE
jgi:hypothetical protein